MFIRYFLNLISGMDINPYLFDLLNLLVNSEYSDIIELILIVLFSGLITYNRVIDVPVEEIIED
jgi:hypothetical protein